MTDKDFRDVVALVEGFLRIAVVLAPKVKSGTAIPNERETYINAVDGLSENRERMARAIAENWSRYHVIGQIAARVGGAGPALVPILKDLRDLAGFQVINGPASARPTWHGRFQQIEFDIRRYRN